MKYKVDWPEARERWTAQWEGRHMGRPCLCVTAPNGRNVQVPPPVSGEQQWLDPDYIVRRMLAGFESTWYGGEAFPGHLIMAGWCVNTYGATPHFPFDTIWFDPIEPNWDEAPDFKPDFNSPWFLKVRAIHEAVLAAAGRNDFLVGQGCFMPGNDMLSFVIGPEQVLTGMAEHPDWIRLAIRQMAGNWVDFVRHFHQLAAGRNDFWYGNTGWMPFWAPEPYVSTQSDISCMISPAMFDDFILPGLDLTGREFKNVWYHLDGQSAFQHLPRLLSLPHVRVIQFVPMPGTPPNGPAHLDLYRRIQAAGKIVHIAVAPQDIEPLVRELDPARLCINTYAASIREGEDLLAAAERWTQGR